MKRQLTEYRWFEEMARIGFPIYAGRKFYATKRPVRSCLNCEFYDIKETVNFGTVKKCLLRVDVEAATNKPLSNCIPCRSKRYVGRGDEEQGALLLAAIEEKCRHEELMDDIDIS